MNTDEIECVLDSTEKLTKYPAGRITDVSSIHTSNEYSRLPVTVSGHLAISLGWSPHPSRRISVQAW